MFEPRPRISHFVVRTVDGGEVDYRSIWQRAQLLLILLDDSAASTRLAAVGTALAARQADLAAVEARLVVTRDVVVGTPRPGVVVADRYGEIAASLDATVETDADDLIDWLRVVHSRCG